MTSKSKVCACGRDIPEAREVYATPTCFVCLPPPQPLGILHLPAHIVALRVKMINKIYRHYKGGKYLVQTLAFDSENRDQLLVVYQSLDKGLTWVRPLTHPTLDAWEDKVYWPDGMMRTRFMLDDVALDDLLYHRPRISACDDCRNTTNTVQQRKNQGKYCTHCWNKRRNGFLTEADISRSDRESIVQTLDKISRLVEHDSEVYTLAQMEAGWQASQLRDKDSLDTVDAYGLPNDLRKAKEEIQDWRQALEAVGWIGGPDTLRKRRLELQILGELTSWLRSEVDGTCCIPFSGQEERLTAFSEILLKINAFKKKATSEHKARQATDRNTRTSGDAGGDQTERTHWPEWNPGAPKTGRVGPGPEGRRIVSRSHGDDLDADRHGKTDRGPVPGHGETSRRGGFTRPKKVAKPSPKKTTVARPKTKKRAKKR